MLNPRPGLEWDPLRLDKYGMIPKSKPIAVIGGGSWGTALAIAAARNDHQVALWLRDKAAAATIEETRRNPVHLSEFELPANITATSSLHEAVTDAGVVLIVVPSHALREIAEQLSDCVGSDALLTSCTKGFEVGSLRRMSEVIRESFKSERVKVAVLSGPSFALEVARGDPTAVVVAAEESEHAQEVQLALSSSLFRIYTNTDVIGVEVCGAVKNVVAIGAGVVRGLGYGTNSVAAIITRGLAEITRLGMALGAKAETMAGLAGLGDLVLTCTGELSRNRRVGFELGRGRTLDVILAEMREVAEGVKTTQAIYDLARRLNIEMPITSSIRSLLYENKSALEAAGELMGRPLKQE